MQATATAFKRRFFGYPEANILMFLLFMAFVVGRYIQINYRMGLLDTIRFEFLLGGASAACAIVKLSGGRPELGRSQPLLVSIVLLFFAMIVQLPMAADPPVARMIFNDRVFKFSILTFLMVAFIESPRYLRFFLMTFLFSVFYIMLEATEGLITGGLYWQNQGIMRLHGAVPIYGHPNSLGGVSLGALPFVWYLWTPWKRWWLRLFLLATATTAIVCIIYSGSRTAYVGVVGLVLWLWYQSERRVRFGARLLVLGVIVVMLLPDQYIERFKSIGGKEKEGASKETRIVILKDAWTIFMENPLGIGVASFPAKRTERFGRSQDTHNLYLEVATNLGIQGLIVFLAMVAYMMIAYRRAIRQIKRFRRRLVRSVRLAPGSRALRRRAAQLDEEMRFTMAAALAGGGFIFSRLVLGLFGMDLYEIYWWFGAGLAMVVSGLLVRFRRAVADLGDAAALIAAESEDP